MYMYCTLQYIRYLLRTYSVQSRSARTLNWASLSTEPSDCESENRFSTQSGKFALGSTKDLCRTAETEKIHH